MASPEIKKIVLTYVVYRKWKNRNNKKIEKRNMWVNPLNTTQARLQHGDYNNLIAEMRLQDRNKYLNHLRMMPERFEELLKLVGPRIQKLHVQREPISPELRLALTLR